MRRGNGGIIGKVNSPSNVYSDGVWSLFDQQNAQSENKWPSRIGALFSGGTQGVWFLPSPLTCYTDTSGTVPANVGDAVAFMRDLSGNGKHATQPTTAARPLLRQDTSGSYYLEFDGVDDRLISSQNAPTAADMDLFIGLDASSDGNDFMLLSDGYIISGGRYIFIADDADVSAGFVRVGSPSVFMDGQSIGSTRNDVFDATRGGPHVAEAQSLDMSDFTSFLSIGNWGGPNFRLNGKIFGIILAESLTADEITYARSYLARLSGVTLP
jgi:hypothetical protein